MVLVVVLVVLVLVTVLVVDAVLVAFGSTSTTGGTVPPVPSQSISSSAGSPQSEAWGARSGGEESESESWQEEMSWSGGSQM